MTRIAHTTDFSAQSMAAFRHALRLGLANRCRLDLLHVKKEGADDAWDSFPHVREVLAEWGLMDARGSPADIESKLGVRVAKIGIKDRDVADGISQFFLTHRPDLLVVATHGRRGVNRWLNGSVSEDVARRTHVPTLLIGPDGHGFIDARSGDMSLRRILVPVTPTPSPARALERLASLLSAAEVTLECFELMHVVERVGPADDVGAGHCRLFRRARRRDDPARGGRAQRRSHRHADGPPSRPHRCLPRQHDKPRHRTIALPGPDVTAGRHRPLTGRAAARRPTGPTRPSQWRRVVRRPSRAP